MAKEMKYVDWPGPDHVTNPKACGIGLSSDHLDVCRKRWSLKRLVTKIKENQCGADGNIRKLHCADGQGLTRCQKITTGLEGAAEFRS